MATSGKNDSTQVENDPRYAKDIEGDITSARKLLEEYSKIPSDQVIAHIHAVVCFSSNYVLLLHISSLTVYLFILAPLKRDKAWKINPYPCVGRFLFLDLSISLHPLYPSVLARLKNSSSSPPQTLLDLGCCFGQEIRRLVADGAPGENLYGADLRLEYLDLGYDLFQDRESLKAHFLEGDIFEEDNTAEGGKELSKLDGKVDIIYAQYFLHLWDWEEQVRAGTRMVRLMTAKRDSVIFGTQVGSTKPGVYPGRDDKNRTRYNHDADSFQKLWDAIGEKTATKWKVVAELHEFEDWARDNGNGGGGDGREETRTLQFQVHRLE